MFLSKPGFDKSASVFKDKKVDIAAYCVMPNHFHFCIKQLKEGGISNFMKQVQHSYTKYFNEKNRRGGVLWQGRFKSVLVKNYEHLIYLTKYIHLNPFKSSKTGKITLLNLEKYNFSSYLEYLDVLPYKISNFKLVLGNKFNISSYKSYIKMTQNSKDYTKWDKTLEEMTVDDYHSIAKISRLGRDKINQGLQR
jgi:putative transposase